MVSKKGIAFILTLEAEGTGPAHCACFEMHGVSLPEYFSWDPYLSVLREPARMTAFSALFGVLISVHTSKSVGDRYVRPGLFSWHFYTSHMSSLAKLVCVCF